MEQFFNAYKFACKSIWHDETDGEVVYTQAQKAYALYKRDCTAGKRIFRLTGQSGSGKTSQLLGATLSYCQNHNIKPLHIAVRNFAMFYPAYAQIAADENVREITNGFALKVLLWVLKFAFEDGLDIVLEIALLDKKFENYIFFEIFSRNYFHFFQIMAVNKKISDIFVFKRQKKIHRITAIKSANYFDAMLQKTFKYLTKKYKFNCAVWSAFDAKAVYVGSSKKAYKFFKNARKKIECPRLNEAQLLSAKKSFLEELYQDGLI